MQAQCSVRSLLALLGFLGSFGRASELVRRGDDAPSNANFVRRSCEAVAVIGDYVYIDGGSITELVNGSDPSSSPTYLVNSTLSIDMTESWTNQTVQFQTISKAAPALDNQIYWTDASTSSLYTWAGSTYSADQPPNAMWRLAADGNGGGEWSEVEQQDFREFSSLVRPVGAAFTQGNSVGYALGGATTPPMDDESTASGSMGNALTGLVSYNLETGQWANSSSAAYGGYGTSLNALAEFVPFGPDGLLLFLGGAESPVEATNETIQQMSLDTVTLYDPASNTWYTQTTSGDRPPTMQSACSVGVQGPNNTYEIFIYGGSSDQLEGTSPDVTVLSLPGFVFVQGESGTPRSDHACAVVGRGRRQMLSVGGVDGTNRTYTAPSTADPWAQGLGIYDMTAMRWTASYDPGAAAYDSPAAVKQWYAGGGQQGVRWDDSGLEALMLNGSTQTGAPQQSPSKSAHGSKNQTGAIAGGVVGGVALLALLAGLAFWLRRRRRQRQRQNPGGPRSGRGERIGSGSSTGGRRSRAKQQQQQHPRGLQDSMMVNEPHADGIIAEYRPEPWPKDDDHDHYYRHRQYHSGASATVRSSGNGSDIIPPRYRSPASGATIVVPPPCSSSTIGSSGGVAALFEQSAVLSGKKSRSELMPSPLGHYPELPGYDAPTLGSELPGSAVEWPTELPTTTATTAPAQAPAPVTLLLPETPICELPERKLDF